MIFDSNLPDIIKFETIRPIIELAKETSKFCAIEKIFGFNDDRRWYRILGFNDYEISNDNFIRSNRRWDSFPFGIIIEPVKYDINGMAYYRLADNKEINRILHISQIQFLRDKANQEKYGHPHYTEVTYFYSNNRGAFIKKSFDTNEELMEFRKKPKDNYRFNECPIKIIKKIEVE